MSAGSDARSRGDRNRGISASFSTATAATAARTASPSRARCMISAPKNSTRCSPGAPNWRFRLTLWVFSTDNFRRPPAEISGIFAAVAAKLNRLARDPAIHERRVRVRAIGCLRLLPQPVLDAIAAAERATAGYDGMELNIALAYGGREEIADAVQALLNELTTKKMSLADAIQRITPEAIGRHLYTAGLPDPDLIIRTSGEVRLSGFLLWQSAHSEFYFTDVLWPAFRKIDFLRAIRSFQQRQRRFGG